MSFGENLQFLRKRGNITQEQLAEKLNVSRQSVSKWESDNTYPEMDNILLLCEMFHCNMDTLMRGNLKQCTVEDTARYDSHMNKFSKLMATGVALVLFGIATNQLMTSGGIADNIASMVFLSFVAVAVCIFIINGLDHSAFCKKYPKINQFYTEEQIDRFEKKFPYFVGAGVTLVIIGIILQTMEFPAPAGFDTGFYDGIFLYIIAAAVPFLVYAAIQKSKYDIKTYNIENEREATGKMSRRGKWYGVIMMSAVILFLISIGIYISRVNGDWGAWRGTIMQYSWLVFPIGGVMCGIVSLILPKDE